MLTVNPHIPVHRNIVAMPLPAPVPTIIFSIPASLFAELIINNKRKSVHLIAY